MLRTAVEFKLSLLVCCLVFFCCRLYPFFWRPKEPKAPAHGKSSLPFLCSGVACFATSFGQKGIVSKFFLLVFGWCGTPSVSYRLQRHLTNSQTVLPLFPKTKRNLLVSFNGAGVVLELPLCAGEVVWRSCGLAIRYPR